MQQPRLMYNVQSCLHLFLFDITQGFVTFFQAGGGLERGQMKCVGYDR